MGQRWVVSCLFDGQTQICLIWWLIETLLLSWRGRTGQSLVLFYLPACLALLSARLLRCLPFVAVLVPLESISPIYPRKSKTCHWISSCRRSPIGRDYSSTSDRYMQLILQTTELTIWPALSSCWELLLRWDAPLLRTAVNSQSSALSDAFVRWHRR